MIDALRRSSLSHVLLAHLPRRERLGGLCVHPLADRAGRSPTPLRPCPASSNQARQAMQQKTFVTRHRKIFSLRLRISNFSPSSTTISRRSSFPTRRRRKAPLSILFLVASRRKSSSERISQSPRGEAAIAECCPVSECGAVEARSRCESTLRLDLCTRAEKCRRPHEGRPSS